MSATAAIPANNVIKVTQMSEAEQARRIDEAIARRAYEIFERQGRACWHELENWRQAESEVRCCGCFGLTSSEESVLAECNLASFERGTIEAWIAPRQLTICGKPTHKKLDLSSNQHPYEGIVFRSVRLPVDIDFSRVTVTAKHHFVEIRLPKVLQSPKLQTLVHAASAR